MRKILTKIVGYEIKISRSVYDAWMLSIANNKPVDPAISGYLLGKATAITESILCKFCKKEILVDEKLKVPFGGFFETFLNNDAHQKCYDEALRKAQRGGK